MPGGYITGRVGSDPKWPGFCIQEVRMCACANVPGVRKEGGSCEISLAHWETGA